MRLYYFNNKRPKKGTDEFVQLLNNFVNARLASYYTATCMFERANYFKSFSYFTFNKVCVEVNLFNYFSRQL